MSEIERIRAAAAHPENWKPVKRRHQPARPAVSPLHNLLTGWPAPQPAPTVFPASAATLAETEEKQHGK